jgi:O-methyltransferase
MKKTIIFGAGPVGQSILYRTKDTYQVIGFVDNDKAKHGTLENLPVNAPNTIAETEFDIVIVATMSGLNTVTKQLLDMGVKREKIYTGFVDETVKSRIIFLERLGEMFRERNIGGCVAEGGVFQGEFAREINRVFPEKKLYLFDTFCGFDERDIATEKESNYSDCYNTGDFNITSEEIVLSKMLLPEMCITRKGYFPETAQGLDETFCFVNLDFDLYQPILAGLEYFYPRMEEGGIILVHDYFAVPGAKAAVKDFEAKTGCRVFPIGDGLSVGICR